MDEKIRRLKRAARSLLMPFIPGRWDFWKSAFFVQFSLVYIGGCEVQKDDGRSNWNFILFIATIHLQLCRNVMYSTIIVKWQQVSHLDENYCHNVDVG